MLRKVWIAAACLAFFAGPADSQQSRERTSTADSAANPEMSRLARAFLGEWDTVEAFARNEFYPHGAERKGTARFTLATGGTSLVEEVHSNGSAGQLDFTVTIWWNEQQKTYEFFTCGNGGSNPCHLRGTARWRDKDFVNEYESPLHGSAKKWQDIFSDITPDSFSLLAAVESDTGALQPMITTKYTRKQTAGR